MLDSDMAPPALTQAADSEQALCGACVLDVRQLDIVADAVSGADFYDVELGRMFDAMVSLRQAGVPIDDTTLLVRQLEKMEVLQEVRIAGAAGRAALMKMLEPSFGKGFSNGFRPTNASLYAAIVRECAMLRRIGEASTSAHADAYKPNPSAKSIAERAIARFESVLAADVDETQDIVSVVESEVIAINKASNEGKPMAISTGFHGLDEVSGGLHPSELTVLAARPSIGKTAFAMDLCVNVAMQGLPVLLVSLEMGSQQIAHRMIARETGIPARRVQKGALTSWELQKVHAARDALKHLALPIKLFATGHATAARVTARARIQAAQIGIKLLVIDYLGLMQSNDRQTKTYERVTAVSREVKLMAQTLNLPVVLLAQLNREGEGTKPTLSHLRDSGAIEQDADNVWFLHRERGGAETELIIAKQRQGEIGALDFAFDGSHMKFTECVATEWLA